MENLQPLSVGLLVSALMRYDHGLFAPYFPDDVIGGLQGPPEERIPIAIDEVIGIYDKIAAGAELETVTERQVAEEFTLKGFYSPAREDGYAVTLDGYGLRGLAEERIAHRGPVAGSC